MRLQFHYTIFLARAKNPIKIFISCTLTLALTSKTLAETFTDGDLPNIAINAPEDKLSKPGEFVTLVFEILSQENIVINAQAGSDQNWRILIQPEEISLVAGQKHFIAITVEIPLTALAFTSSKITLELSVLPEVITSQAIIEVEELIDLDLETLPELSLDEDNNLEVTMIII